MKEQTERKGKYWTQPEEKKWTAIFADGKLLGVLEEGHHVNRTVARLKGLAGIRIQKATPLHHAKYNTKTVLPSRICKKMKAMHEQAEAAKNKGKSQK